MIFLAAYLACILAVSYLLYAWFYSGLPIILTELLRKFGFRKEDDAFWDSITSRDTWETTICIYYPNLFTELITCRICLSFHFAFWVGAAALAVLWVELPWYFPVITAFAVPLPALLLLNLVINTTHGNTDE